MPERLTDRDVEKIRSELFGELRAWLDQHEKRDTIRFDTIRTAQDKIQRSVDEMNGKVGRMNAEIGYGLPEPDERGDRPTLLERVGGLEKEEAMASAIHDAYARSFARWQKIALFNFAAIAAIAGVLRLIGVGG